MQTGNDAVVFDVGEAADVNDKLRAASAAGDFETGTLDVTIGQAQTFADLPKTKPGNHVSSGTLRQPLFREYNRITIALRIRNSAGSVAGRSDETLRRVQAPACEFAHQPALYYSVSRV